MNCIIVDDEPLALKLLEDNVSKVPYLQLKTSCKDAFGALKALQENTIDLMFIDIQMPALSGLDFIKTLQNKPMVIFITAYKQYALESFDLAIVDYLVKPVALDRFIKACNRARDLFELNKMKIQASQYKDVDYFFVNVDYSQIKIKFEDISWMEGLRDYIKIYLKSTQRPLVVRTSLKAIETEIPANKFIRIHKSYIVSIESITSIRKNSLFINEMELPVGETFREAIAKFISK